MNLSILKKDTLPTGFQQSRTFTAIEVNWFVATNIFPYISCLFDDYTYTEECYKDDSVAFNYSLVCNKSTLWFEEPSIEIPLLAYNVVSEKLALNLNSITKSLSLIYQGKCYHKNACLNPQLFIHTLFQWAVVS